MSRNAPSKETAAHIRATFLSIVWPITAFVPFSRTVSRQIRPFETCPIRDHFLSSHHMASVLNRTRTHNNIRIYLLFLQTVLITARPGAKYTMQLSDMLTVNFIFCPSKASSWRFKSISCNGNEPGQCISKLKRSDVLQTNTEVIVRIVNVAVDVYMYVSNFCKIMATFPEN